ncbi:IS200/IS605 family transposase [Candidatus Woesearchaeota archaeon]|nr:IS200/IS605 family transposase [Candidatus Woesearchaeota archaeon]
MIGPKKLRQEVGQNAYHFVWKPKYARNPFRFETVRKHCDQFLREIAERWNMEVYELQIESDHVHMFVEIGPIMSVSKALQLLKGGSSYKLFRQHPWLRKHFRKGHFWSPGKFFRSVGNVTTEVIQSYINNSHHGWHFPKQTSLSHFS